MTSFKASGFETGGGSEIIVGSSTQKELLTAYPSKSDTT